MNYFEIFDLQISTQIDLEKLEEKYCTFQQQFHPDKASSSDIEKSILLNEGFEVLKKSDTRLAYILKLHGINILDDSNAPKVDNATLQEVWDFQEKMIECSSAAKQELQSNLKEKIKELLEETTNEINTQNYTKAAQILIKHKYFNKILKSLK